MLPSELLATPDKWTQRENARDEFGRSVNFNDPKAVCFCAYGALYLCGISKLDPRFIALRENVMPLWVSEWNDRSTHAEVVSALKEVGL